MWTRGNIHLLTALSPDSVLTEREVLGPIEVEAGTYYLVQTPGVTARVPYPGPYSLLVEFEPQGMPRLLISPQRARGIAIRGRRRVRMQARLWSPGIVEDACVAVPARLRRPEPLPEESGRARTRMQDVEETHRMGKSWTGTLFR